MKYRLYGATGYMRLYASIGSQKVVRFARGYSRGVQKMLEKMPNRVMNSAGNAIFRKRPLLARQLGALSTISKKWKLVGM